MGDQPVLRGAWDAKWKKGSEGVQARPRWPRKGQGLQETSVREAPNLWKQKGPKGHQEVPTGAVPPSVYLHLWAENTVLGPCLLFSPGLWHSGRIPQPGAGLSLGHGFLTFQLWFLNLCVTKPTVDLTTCMGKCTRIACTYDSRGFIFTESHALSLIPQVENSALDS